MSIIQISKIQQRYGELVDLPQLDQAEFGFAADVNRLFIGKTTGNTENVEVLTAYSDISFSQIEGSGNTNLNISSATVANGQVLAYDGTAWVNKGGNVGGLINLGSVTDVKLGGPSGINYVLTNDGTGNLSWTPKAVITANIADISQANPGIVTTTEDIYLTNGSLITITRVNGMTQVNGESYYIGNLTNNTFALYDDVTLTNAVNTTGFSAYTSNGIITCAVGGSEGAANAAGSNTQVQFNLNNLLFADSSFTFNSNANVKLLSVANIQINNTANLGDVANVRILGGGPGNILTTYGNGVLYWGSGGNTIPTDYYLHNQSSASNTWTVIHNLNTQFLDVTPIDSSGCSLVGGYDFPSINYINANALTLTFSSATTGYAVLVGDAANSSQYYQEQFASSATWTVNHNLNTQYVAVTPVLSNNHSWLGRYDYPTVFYNNANSVTVTFSSATSGNVAIVGNSTSSSYYLHNQAAPSTTWTVDHNLGVQYVSVTPIAANGYSYVGRYDYPEVCYTNANSLTLTFSSAVTGNVVCYGSPGFETAGAAGGLDTQVQYNDSGVLNGSASFTFDKSLEIVSITNLETANISTGAAGTSGTITGNWTLTSGSRLQATYADLAEYYAADKAYVPGTVLEFGGQEEVTLAGIESQKLAGVVSTEPAYVMNGNIQAQYPVVMALIGRVPVRAVGRVSKGDMLVSAGNGLAKSSSLTPKIGTVIGKAITNKSSEGEGMVEVLVGRI